MSTAQSFALHEFHNSEFMKQQYAHSLEFLSFHSPSDVAAPSPDLFESDIDSNFNAFPDQLQLWTVDSNDAYTFCRTETPQWQGPPSCITVSSESHDSLSAHSDSLYSDSLSSYTPPTSSTLPTQQSDFDLEMEFTRVRVGGSEYAAVQPSINLMNAATDTLSFGHLPPTPPRSPPVTYAISKGYEKPYVPRSSYSDYGHPRRPSTGSTASSDYYSQIGYTVSPSHMTAALPAVTSVTLQGTEEKADPRKKYKCNICPRAFARAYNLKTHMATHDPNRLKPHVCPQRSCGRSFSRKHDLGRHLISIHRDEANGAHLLPMMNKRVGVDGALRGWCDSCGKSWVGRNLGCNCSDIKDIK